MKIADIRSILAEHPDAVFRAKVFGTSGPVVIQEIRVHDGSYPRPATTRVVIARIFGALEGDGWSMAPHGREVGAEQIAAFAYINPDTWWEAEQEAVAYRVARQEEVNGRIADATQVAGQLNQALVALGVPGSFRRQGTGVEATFSVDNARTLLARLHTIPISLHEEEVL